MKCNGKPKKQLEFMQDQIRVLTARIEELQALSAERRLSRSEERERANANETEGGKPTTRK